MKYLKLITAILLETRNFLNLNKSFTAYDIAMSLRKRVTAKLGQAQEMYITDVDCLASGTPEINFSQVGAIMEELYNEDLLPVQCIKVGGANTYSALPQEAKVAPQTTPTNLAVVAAEVELEQLVVGYVKRKLNKGQLPTLKGVQSRLKNFPVTVKDIQKICLNKGFKVTPQAGLKPSLAVIYK